MTPTKRPPSILGRAMLVNVSIGAWRARKHDRDVTDKVNTEMAKSHDAGRYHKRLLGGKAPSHSALTTAVHAARTAHYRQTLPWEDEGWRLLPTANYFEYTEAMRKVQARFEEALEVFLTEYPELVIRARDYLGQMYRAKDYPTTEQVRQKFHFTLQFGPLPTGGDFRVSLPDEEMAAMARGVEDRVNQAVTDAMEDAWARLGDAVHNFSTRLHDGKRLRSTLITRVVEVAEILGRLNLTKDKALEETRKKVLKELSLLDVETLRDDDKVRKNAAKKADAILASMKEVYSA